MIRIRRPARVPPKLAQQRRNGLRRAFAALNAHGAGSAQLHAALTGYDGGKETLFLAQHKKCAFCERRAVLAANPLDHFRPKLLAWRHLPQERPARTDPGYWWLTWSWKNHLFCCHACNSGYKQNYFPLAVGSRLLMGPAPPYRRRRLLPAHEDTSLEASLLVDPASEDPLDHIEWRPVNPSHPKRLWKWSPAPLTPKGEATIRVVGLGAHVDIIGSHIRDHVLARAEEVCALVDSGQLALSRAKWLALANDVARSDCELAGPTWNALHYLVDTKRRVVANLPILPRP